MLGLAELRVPVILAILHRRLTPEPPRASPPLQGHSSSVAARSSFRPEEPPPPRRPPISKNPCLPAPGTSGDLLPDVLRHVGCLPNILRRVGCLGLASLAGASASVMAAGSASSVRTTKNIEWVGVNREMVNMVIFTKKLIKLMALTEWHLTGSHDSGVEGCEI
jgi:hypothetical protein